MTNMLDTNALATVAGPLKDFFEKLAGADGQTWFTAFKRFLRKENPWSVVDITNFKFDKTHDGWKLLEDVGFIPEIKSVKDLILTTFLKSGEDSINGEELVSRARGELKANYGQIHAEYLLEHQAEIPQEFRKYYLVFPGTIWRGPGGRRCVPYLYWGGGRWCLSWGWLDDGWDGDGRLLRPRE